MYGSTEVGNLCLLSCIDLSRHKLLNLLIFGSIMNCSVSGFLGKFKLSGLFVKDCSKSNVMSETVMSVSIDLYTVSWLLFMVFFIVHVYGKIRALPANQIVKLSESQNEVDKDTYQKIENIKHRWSILIFIKIH